MRRTLLRFINRTLGALAIIIIYLTGKGKNIFKLTSNRKINRKKDFKNILLIKIIGIGDTVLMLPGIKRLKERYPYAKITALVTPISKGILSDQPLLDEIIVYDIFGKHTGIGGFIKIISLLNKKKFDLVIDYEQHIKLITILSHFTGAEKIIGFVNPDSNRGYLLTDRIMLDGNKHMVESFNELLLPLGIKSQPERLEKIKVSDKDTNYVNEWLQSQKICSDDLLIGIHSGSGERALSRRWDKERYAAIGDRLIDEFQAKVIFTGSHSEIPLIRETARLMKNSPIISAGCTSLKQLVALIDRFDLFISNDTGPMHIGPAMGTPTIGPKRPMDRLWEPRPLVFLVQMPP